MYTFQQRSTSIFWPQEAILNRMPTLAGFRSKMKEMLDLSNHIVINIFVSKTLSVVKKKTKSGRPLVLMIL